MSMRHFIGSLCKALWIVWSGLCLLVFLVLIASGQHSIANVAVMLIGGGIIFAPLFWLARRLRRENAPPSDPVAAAPVLRVEQSKPVAGVIERMVHAEAEPVSRIEQSKPVVAAPPAVRPAIALVAAAFAVGILALIVVPIRQQWAKAEQSQRAEAPRVHLTPEMKEGIEDLLATGVARVDIQLRKVWLDPRLWHLADALGKEDLAATFAIYFAHQHQKDLYFCSVWDKQSGHRLARYSQTFGFRLD